ncbi:hypothetical protein [Mesorhizobium sp. Z1-4]|uniref:hypothetical protein n=1 Tax=Mesorhizobium sp. Z1-4 TaxID=2448478 RepID=UPI000FD97B1E|nr:hypothetical protein [Mesorhizobium sp. Z1-4]
MNLARQREAIAEWKERFKSFRSGSFADAERLARSEAGRMTLESALNALISEIREEDYPDYEMFDHLGRDLAKCWPKETAPHLVTPMNVGQTRVVQMIDAAFATHGHSSRRDSPRAAGG